MRMVSHVLLYSNCRPFVSSLWNQEIKKCMLVKGNEK